MSEQDGGFSDPGTYNRIRELVALEASAAEVLRTLNPEMPGPADAAERCSLSLRSMWLECDAPELMLLVALKTGVPMWMQVWMVEAMAVAYLRSSGADLDCDGPKKVLAQAEAMRRQWGSNFAGAAPRCSLNGTLVVGKVGAREMALHAAPLAVWRATAVVTCSCGHKERHDADAVRSLVMRAVELCCAGWYEQTTGSEGMRKAAAGDLCCSAMRTVLGYSTLVAMARAGGMQRPGARA